MQSNRSLFSNYGESNNFDQEGLTVQPLDTYIQELLESDISVPELEGIHGNDLKGSLTTRFV